MTTYKATLIHGNVHYCGETRFENGVEVEVTSDVKALLEKCVQKLSASNGKEIEVPRFEFAEVSKETSKPKRRAGADNVAEDTESK